MLNARRPGSGTTDRQKPFPSFVCQWCRWVFSWPHNCLSQFTCMRPMPSCPYVVRFPRGAFWLSCGNNFFIAPALPCMWLGHFHYTTSVSNCQVIFQLLTRLNRQWHHCIARRKRLRLLASPKPRGLVCRAASRKAIVSGCCLLLSASANSHCEAKHI